MEPNAVNTILIADDDHGGADALAQVLDLYGYQVFLAYDGLEAVEIATDKHPDVVILDITLPKLNGFSVARRLRTYAWSAQTKLIAITGWSPEEVGDAVEHAGFESYFVKPVDPIQLLAAIECGDHQLST